MEKKCFIVLAFLSITISIYSQQTTLNYEKLVPSSPQVTELSKYVVVPVSYYTGIPDITISLGSLVCGNIIVPVSLSYYAGGIQVDQIASNVGLGWSLHAGGSIAQIVNGLNDFVSNRFTLTYDDLKRQSWPDDGIVHSLNEPMSMHDSEPDFFTYNFQSFSGRFLFDGNGKICELKGKCDINFTLDKTGSDGPQIKGTDLLGNQYYFHTCETSNTFTHQYILSFDPLELAEVTFAKGQPVPAKNYIPTAYHLDKITSVDKTRSVIFNYDDETDTYSTRLSGSLIYSTFSNKWEAYHRTDKLVTAPQLTKTIMTQKAKRLQSIIGDNGESYTFLYDNDYRKDLSGSKALKQIIQKDCEGRILKTWTFLYGYFSSYPQITDTDQQDLNYRLKLLSIIETGSLETDKVYRFDYYGDTAQNDRMPYRNAYCGQDMWGYCNAREVTISEAGDICKIFPNLQVLNAAELKSVDYNSLRSHDITFPQGSNREVNGDCVNLYSLKSVYYPTGGRSEYIYEPNSYSYANNVGLGRTVLGGGLRIKEIRNYSDSLTYSSQKYDYTDTILGVPHSSTGAILSEPMPVFQSVQAIIPYDEKSQILDFFLQLSSFPYCALYSLAGDAIGYSRVTEKNSEGRSVYDFYSIKDAPEKYYCSFYSVYSNGKEIFRRTRTAQEPYPITYAPGNGYSFFANAPNNAYTGESYKRGLPLQKAIYDNSDRIKQKEKYNYNFYTGDTIYGADVTHHNGNGIETIVGIHSYLTGKSLLSEKIISMYERGTTLKSLESYRYTDFDLPSEVTQTVSGGETETTLTRYPVDINSTPYDAMKDLHMVNIPIEKIVKRNGKITTGTLVTYRALNGTFLPDTQYSMETAEPLDSFNLYNGVKKDTHYRIESIALRYDAKNNIAEMSDKSGMNYVLIWGYNYEYPVAEIRNASYEQVSALLPMDNVQPWVIESIREKLPNAQITTYSYLPHIGMTSKTDEKGVKSTYYYDQAGRLEVVRDHNGNVIHAYHYHYANK